MRCCRRAAEEAQLQKPSWEASSQSLQWSLHLVGYVQKRLSPLIKPCEVR